jgi:MFS transporter, DHA1 family, inner membrane transport protein
MLTFLGFAATFSAVAYVGPLVTRISGLDGTGVGLMQMMIGLGSIVGVVAGARAADRANGTAFVAASFLVSAVALAAYSLLMGLPTGTLFTTVLLSLAMMAGAAALFARTPVIQTLLVQAAPDAQAVVLALNGSMVFLGQGIGAAIGGAGIVAFGIEVLGLAGAVVALGGFALVIIASQRTTYARNTDQTALAITRRDAS